MIEIGGAPDVISDTSDTYGVMLTSLNTLLSAKQLTAEAETEIETIINALGTKVDSLGTELKKKLADHLANKKAHGETQATIGLDKVKNYGAATVAQAKLLTETELLVTPAGLTGAIEQSNTKFKEKISFTDEQKNKVLTPGTVPIGGRFIGPTGTFQYIRTKADEMVNSLNSNLPFANKVSVTRCGDKVMVVPTSSYNYPVPNVQTYVASDYTLNRGMQFQPGVKVSHNTGSSGWDNQCIVGKDAIYLADQNLIGGFNGVFAKGISNNYRSFTSNAVNNKLMGADVKISGTNLQIPMCVLGITFNKSKTIDRTTPIFASNRAKMSITDAYGHGGGANFSANSELETGDISYTKTKPTINYTGNGTFKSSLVSDEQTLTLPLTEFFDIASGVTVTIPNPTTSDGKVPFSIQTIKDFNVSEAPDSTSFALWIGLVIKVTANKVTKSYEVNLGLVCKLTNQGTVTVKPMLTDRLSIKADGTYTEHSTGMLIPEDTSSPFHPYNSLGCFTQDGGHMAAFGNGDSIVVKKYIHSYPNFMHLIKYGKPEITEVITKHIGNGELSPIDCGYSRFVPISMTADGNITAITRAISHRGRSEYFLHKSDGPFDVVVSSSSMNYVNYLSTNKFTDTIAVKGDWAESSLLNFNIGAKIPNGMCVASGTFSGVKSSGLAFNSKNGYSNYSYISENDGAISFGPKIKLGPVIYTELVGCEKAFLARALAAYKANSKTTSSSNYAPKFNFQVYGYSGNRTKGIILISDGVGYVELGFFDADIYDRESFDIKGQTLSDINYTSYVATDTLVKGTRTHGDLDIADTYDLLIYANVESKLPSDDPEWALTFTNAYGDMGGTFSILVDHLDTNAIPRETDYSLKVFNYVSNLRGFNYRPYLRYQPLLIPKVGLYDYSFNGGVTLTRVCDKSKALSTTLTGSLYPSFAGFDVTVGKIVIPKGTKFLINGNEVIVKATKMIGFDEFTGTYGSIFAKYNKGELSWELKQTSSFGGINNYVVLYATIAKTTKYGNSVGIALGEVNIDGYRLSSQRVPFSIPFYQNRTTEDNGQLEYFLKSDLIG